MLRVVRSFFAFITSTIFGGLLLLTAFAFAVRFTLAEPTVVKGWLSNSGLYESIVEEVAKNMTLQQASEESVVQVSSDEIVDVAQAAFPSSELKREGEVVIDSFYAWLKGDTSSPEFRVDFSGEKAAFATAMTNLVERKINELPECTDAGRFSIQAFDPFKADCRPKGIDLTQELVEFEKQISESGDFLSQAEFNGGDIKLDKNGQQERVGSALPWAQNAYKAVIWAPWALIALSLITGLAVIFLSATRRKGIRRAASSLFLSGVSLLISGLFLGTFLQDTIRTTVVSNEAQQSITDNIVNPLLEQIVDVSFAKYSIYFGVAFFALSLFMYAGLLLTRKKSVPEAHHDGQNEQPPAVHTQAPVYENPPTPAPTPTPAPLVETQTPIQSMPLQPSYAPRPQPIPQVVSAPAPVPPLPSASQPNPAPTHTRPHRQVTRRPPMIQG